ncbi:cell division protein FtsQ/DivIB [Paenibacillus sp. TY11]|uniref:cell division protein FtsQ/DivIB n=1 Tax=Paenibacillus sp. TY11 TaxID=3448633 RepID=UPI0040396828
MPNAQIPVLKKNRTKKRTSRKITILLILLFIVLLAVLFFRSSLSRVSEIRFDGNVFSTRDQLLNRSGLAVGDQYFGVSSSDISEKLREIQSIQQVIVDKQFPGIITIHIKEFATVAYELQSDGSLRAILANGTSVGVGNSGIAVEKPILTKWKSDDPYKAKLCDALSRIPGEWTADISEIIPAPIPSFPDRIKMYTRSQFEVITTVSLLDSKISYLNQVLETEDPGLITMLEADSYVPFKPDTSEESQEKDTTQ